jgi:hypothetical protein
VERLVEEADDLLGVPGSGLAEGGDLAGEQPTDRGHEHDHADQDEHEHQHGRQAAPPAPAGQRVDRRLHGQRHEEGDEQEDEQIAQPADQPERNIQTGRAEQQARHPILPAAVTAERRQLARGPGCGIAARCVSHRWRPVRWSVAHLALRLRARARRLLTSSSPRHPASQRYHRVSRVIMALTCGNVAICTAVPRSG